MNFWMPLFLGIAAAATMFFLGWAWARKLDNYSLVDVLWAYGIGLVASSWLLCCGDGSAKHWLAGTMVALWSLRLGSHLHRRVAKAHPQEDARYAKLREVWHGRVASSFFWFFQAQAVSVVLLALPFLWIAIDPDSSWDVWESLGLSVSLIGIAGETLADAQMTRFKSKHHEATAVCRDGLWRYSRHPNYFFEAVIWTGFYLFCCGSQWGWLMFHAPATIVYLLLKVTGIPPTEAAAVLRKGDAYRQYQQSTSAFVPWPPGKLKTNQTNKS